ncbi:hypothetical protein RFM26_02860 [Mesorhizobium sp. VK23B]|uniref:Secreted protein n=1 Tax=Mesorhizobium dulcispinae TaxID=3072316 RepID=A0ABU4XBS6_9HYPH|nr:MULTISPECIES: hypothetical protein [unclassified Mesorhizobium]MDX8464623.1 hypothetical protein [Mesorhizobium sp. VK23B]MDX8471009.1 hypothetical protein [Mesorhizobium sp. VK23A]
MTDPLAGSWRVFTLILAGWMFQSIEPNSISFKRGDAASHHASSENEEKSSEYWQLTVGQLSTISPPPRNGGSQSGTRDCTARSACVERLDLA